ncbi:MAG: hypothetical protein WD185_02245 [Sneathiella sp.]
MSEFAEDSAVFGKPAIDSEALANIESNLGFTRHRVIAQENYNDWTHELNARFNKLTSLKIGWDGYRGKPVSFTCAKFAAVLLERLFVEGVPVPTLVPGSDGTLQIEWHRNQYDVEIDVFGANNVVASRYDHLSDREECFELQSDFSEIAGWIGDLIADRDVVLQNEA